MHLCHVLVSLFGTIVKRVGDWGNKELLAVHYGEFEEARGWVILNNARAERVHYSESPTESLFKFP